MELIVLLVLINTASAISKTINVNVVETRNISLYFIQVNTIDDFNIVVNRNTDFLQDGYKLTNIGW